MINKLNKNTDRRARHERVRKVVNGQRKVFGTVARPRLNVYRSTTNIYAQIINDETGNTLVACNSLEKEIAKLVKGKTKKEAAKVVGEQIAKRAKENKIKKVVFDRGGYLYTGRVQALADGARNGGLEF